MRPAAGDVHAPQRERCRRPSAGAGPVSGLDQLVLAVARDPRDAEDLTGTNLEPTARE